MRGGLAREHGGKQHAVIGEPRLVADHGDRITSRARPSTIHRPDGRSHSIADDDQRLAHDVSSLGGLGAAVGFRDHVTGHVRKLRSRPRRRRESGLAKPFFQRPQQGATDHGGNAQAWRHSCHGALRARLRRAEPIPDWIDRCPRQPASPSVSCAALSCIGKHRPDLRRHFEQPIVKDHCRLFRYRRHLRKTCCTSVT